MPEMTVVLEEWRGWAKTNGLSHATARLDALGIPHRPTPLPPGWQGVYGFRWRGSWLKVGKAGPNSNARWESQHYNPGSAMSNLAFSLVRYGRLATIEEPSLPGLRAELHRVDPDDMADWIKKHTERVNILIGSEAGRGGLEELESIAQRLLRPVFEGAWRYGGPAA